MKISEAKKEDLKLLSKIYLYLNEDDKDIDPEIAQDTWSNILKDENYHILIIKENDIIVSTVTLIVIKNLTRNVRPYALIENVVTHPSYRKKGYAKKLIERGINIAIKNNCYKIMLMTSSKNEGVFEFYEKCGLNRKEKTGFVLRLK